MTEDFKQWWWKGEESHDLGAEVEETPMWWAYEGWVAGQKAAYAKCIAECKAEIDVEVSNAHPEYNTGREMGATLCMNRIIALGEKE